MDKKFLKLDLLYQNNAGFFTHNILILNEISLM